MRKKYYLVPVGFFVLTALASAAHATPPPAIATEAEPKWDHRTEVNLGLLLGGSDIGEQQRSTFGLQASLGRRFGDLVLLAEYNHLSIGKESSDNRGSMNRLGVVARYSLLRTSGKPKRRGRSPISGDYWFEAGAGMQRLAWDAGGTLTRPDLILGFGWQLNGVIGRKSKKPRYYGPYVAFRANLSRAPESSVDVPAMCGGPCDTETQPSKNDVSMFFHFGVNWGR